MATALAAAKNTADRDDAKPLTGASLLIAALAIGVGNFMVVLDTTIANVSVPTIAGSLGVSTSQGTWVITGYSVAEAITVPLTGWLTKRFGAQRVFIACYFAFGIISVLCGAAFSLNILIVGRVLLGLAGGPIMPLSQMLLLRIFPKEKATLATVLWAMTTLIGPIAGPILGGIICDTIGWQWIFFIKVPVALIGGGIALVMLRNQQDPKEKASIDTIGLIFLITWVAALQILLDEGRDDDWFASPLIQILAAIAAVGFACFIAWEITEKNPIVDLRIFRHRGFTASALTYAVAFGAFFASLVIIPLWLQQNMGYTATLAGYATGMIGVFAVFSAPLVGKLIERIDPRLVVCLGILGLGLMSFWRALFDSDVTFLQMAWPTLASGPFMVMFFVPVTGLALASVSPEETANAAGLSNFMRTLAGSFATCLVQTGWGNAESRNQTQIAGALNHGRQFIENRTAAGASPAAAVSNLAQLVQGQSVMLATIDMFNEIAVVFGFAALLIWFVPKPRGPINTNAAH